MEFYNIPGYNDMSFKTLRFEIVTGQRDLETLVEFKPFIEKAYDLYITFREKIFLKLTDKNEEIHTPSISEYMDELRDFLYILLDYYTYSETGDVLVSCTKYDMLMEVYTSYGYDRIIYADVIKGIKRWSIKPHSAPGMVGSLDKIYEIEDLYKYLEPYTTSGYTRTRKVKIGPKFDGISACITVDDMDYFTGALTRYDGISGQDITEVVKRANRTYLNDMIKKCGAGYYKVELCMSTEDLEELQMEKAYSNRRSATSGIVNTPTNLEYAKYITIIPLAYSNVGSEFNKKDSAKFLYEPLDSFEMEIDHEDKRLPELIHKLIMQYHSSDYPFRTDGVVIYPVGDDINVNFSDIMDCAIAFKVNTEEAFTKVRYLYMSIGRSGKAVPMAKVAKVECNETNVEDVSLGSYDKYVTRDIHEDETVIVFSAGLVIPQIRMPEEREYPKHAKLLILKKECPYCGASLERRGNEYFCVNQECPRIISGNITNFLDKLGVEGVSDETINTLYEKGLIWDIPSVFSLKREDISKLENFGQRSADIIVSEIEKLKENPICISDLFGSLGIPSISKKKCRKIFKEIDLNDLKKKKMKLVMKLVEIDGIGGKTADVFIKYVKNNEELIEFLLGILNIVPDRKWNGEIAFTGFRDAELQNFIETKYNYEVTDSVTSETIAVVANNYDPNMRNPSGKIKTALAKGIDIVSIKEINTLLDILEKNSHKLESQYV